MKTSITEHKAKKNNLKSATTVALFWVAVWAVLYLVVGKDVLLPSPKNVAVRFLELCGTFIFWKTLLTSCVRVAVGFLIALAIGFVMGYLCYRFSVLNRLFAPLLRIITTTPVASFIILALVWISSDRLPVFIIFLMVLPMVWNNVYQGIKSIDKELLEMLVIFEVPLLKRVKSLYLPSLMPYLSATFSTGVGFAWKAGVAAEVIALPQISVGKQIYNSKVYFETTDLFAWTIAAILLSFLLEKASLWILGNLQNYVFKNREVSEIDTA